MKFNHLATFATVIITTLDLCASAKNSSSEKIQLEIQPEQVGESIISNLVERRFGWRYQKVCSYYGALIFADVTDNKNISEQIKEGYAPFYNEKRKPKSGHVDYIVFGIWPFELYRQFGDTKYLDLAKKSADEEWKNPRNDGLTDLSRFWIDDMYMVGSLQLQAYGQAAVFWAATAIIKLQESQ